MWLQVQNYLQFLLQFSDNQSGGKRPTVSWSTERLAKCPSLCSVWQGSMVATTTFSPAVTAVICIDLRLLATSDIDSGWSLMGKLTHQLLHRIHAFPIDSKWLADSIAGSLWTMDPPTPCCQPQRKNAPKMHQHLSGGPSSQCLRQPTLGFKRGSSTALRMECPYDTLVSLCLHQIHHPFPTATWICTNICGEETWEFLTGLRSNSQVIIWT